VQLGYFAEQLNSLENLQCYNNRVNIKIDKSMGDTTYELVNTEDNQPATKADVERIMQAIEYLAEQINSR
jgi:hypothetical protein